MYLFRSLDAEAAKRHGTSPLKWHPMFGLTSILWILIIRTRMCLRRFPLWLRDLASELSPGRLVRTRDAPSHIRPSPRLVPLYPADNLDNLITAFLCVEKSESLPSKDHLFSSPFHHRPKLYLAKTFYKVMAPLVNMHSTPFPYCLQTTSYIWTSNWPS